MFPEDGSHFGKVEIDDITERRFPGRPEIDGPSRLLHCRQLGDRPLVRLGVAQENPGLIPIPSVRDSLAMQISSALIPFPFGRVDDAEQTDHSHGYQP